jgi:Ser/Thr protein kinase RdoA (MazF antagonist)
MTADAELVVRTHWFDVRTIEPIVGGLINETFRVTTVAADTFALQRVSPIFDPAIHHNIEAVTAHLERAGLATPRLVHTRDQQLFAAHAGEIWRLTTWIDGHAFATARSARQLRDAGRLVGRVHAALDSLDHSFVGMRLGVHDTGAHLSRLERALAEHPRHRLIEDVAPLGRAILAAARELPGLPSLGPRVCHGDLKLSNVLFAGASAPACERALCLVDLDTLGPMALAHELGDALRSWCNPRSEDQEPSFDPALMQATVAGYGEGLGRSLSRAERRALLAGLEHVCLELAARFAADALNEQYFGFDHRRYAARGEHNLVRAMGQWALYRSVAELRSERAAILELLPSEPV